jgi:hypothetical protein
LQVGGECPVQPQWYNNNFTQNQNRAIEQALSYLDCFQTGHFSKTSLIRQLVNQHNFSTTDATLAVDWIGRDWKQDCLVRGQWYIDGEYGKSESSLKSQLLHDGFSEDEVEYTINNIVVDWNQEAVEYVTQHYWSNCTKVEIIYYTKTWGGFTQEQATYGVTYGVMK